METTPNNLTLVKGDIIIENHGGFLVKFHLSTRQIERGFQIFFMQTTKISKSKLYS